MASLRFWFGTMGSGKSTLALQIHHNLVGRGFRGLLLTEGDRLGSQVTSRLGVSSDATCIRPEFDLFRLALGFRAVDFIVCDEIQFFESEQVDQLARAVDELDIDVYAFGLLTSFQGTLFPATTRCLELADERHELTVETRCWCGLPATHNARVVDGEQVTEGDLVIVGDTGASLRDPSQGRLDMPEVPDVTYEVVCRRHWLARQPVAPDSDLEHSNRR